MKLIWKILLGLGLLLVIVLSALAAFVYSTSPTYNGTYKMASLEDTVTIHLDEYGVPHIYANHEEDAYFALGFMHAQERLFQMEMLRRAASGRLSEILGPDFIQTDKFFRSLGINKTAKASVEKYLSSSDSPHQRAAMAYQEGINSFIRSGEKPIEFYIMGIPLQEFTPEDFYFVAGFMSVGFAEGLRTDPILSSIVHKFDSSYLHSFSMHSIPGMYYPPSYQADSLMAFSNEVNSIFETLPVPLLHGSNGWVIGKEKSDNGRVMLANDTHIGYSQPAVWYEAHLNFEGQSIYGNYIAGFPFAMLGQNKDTAWGLTMLENDDVDFYIEETHPEDSLRVLSKGEWVQMELAYDTIFVKDAEPVPLVIKSTHHGPVINEAIDNFPDEISQPVSLYWNFTKQESNLIHGAYVLNTGKTVFDLRRSASMIHAPGLNVMAADRENIGWFTAASLINRPEHVNSKIFLDGTGKDDPDKDYNFSYNPGAINTPWDFVYTSNNQPDSIQGVFHAGYYMPEDRGRRIKSLLEKSETITLDDMRNFQLNVTSPYAREVASYLLEIYDELDIKEDSRSVIEVLRNWDGSQNREEAHSAIYYTLLAKIFTHSMADEIGTDMLHSLSSLAVFKRSMLIFLKDESSPWWDNISTDVKETRKDILLYSLEEAIQTLEENLGNDRNNWQWAGIHSLTHPHPLGTVEALAPYFNVGPFEVDGGNETINNMMITLSADGKYPVRAGPSMRKVVVLGETLETYGILPTGQSGHFLSPHYDDQAKMHAEGEFRIFWTEKDDVIKNSKNKITLLPNE